MPHAWKQTIQINEKIATKLIQTQQHVQVDSIRLLDEGWDNVVYLVNQDLIFRFPRRELGLACMENEIALLPFIADQVSFSLSSPSWIGLPSTLYPYPFAGYSMIQGIPLCDAFSKPINDDNFAITLAGWLKELHAISVDSQHVAMVHGDFHGKLAVGTRTSHCKNNLERYQYYFEQAGFDKNALFNVLSVLSQFKFSSTKPSFLHGDLYSRHIIVNPSTLLPAGLIDWGDVHIGPPGIDLSSGMVFSERALGVFLTAYGGVDDQMHRMMIYHSFCHGMSFLPYAFEQGKEELKCWATIVLQRCVEEIEKLHGIGE